MVTIDIYKNYGVLGWDKQYVYTFGCQHSQAVCSDLITVGLPDGWSLCHNVFGDFMVESPWGFVYDINEVLTGNKRPQFRALDNSGNLKYFYLIEI